MVPTITFGGKESDDKLLLLRNKWLNRVTMITYEKRYILKFHN
jgi:hypothetical protein